MSTDRRGSTMRVSGFRCGYPGYTLLDARLVLILANHIGDLDVLKEAIALAAAPDRI